jgi:hypothetical protein
MQKTTEENEHLFVFIGEMEVFPSELVNMMPTSQ